MDESDWIGNNKIRIRGFEVIDMATPAAIDYDALLETFREYHQDPINVALHLVTTPLGILAFISLLNRITGYPLATATLALAYALRLISDVSSETFATTALLLIFIFAIDNYVNVGWKTALILIVLSYGGQDLAHVLTGEKTYQSSYSDGGQVDLANFSFWYSMFYQHCYYLLPLCVDLVLKPAKLCGTVFGPQVAVVLDWAYTHSWRLVLIPALVIMGRRTALGVTSNRKGGKA